MQITNYLEQHNVHYQLRSHKPAFTAQQIAAEEHIPGMYVAKPVVVQADGKYYMCVLPACCKIDLNQLRGHLNAGEIQLANEKEMAKLFPDCEIGAEPPFGNMFNMTTLVDKSLEPDDYIVFQAGQHDQAVQIKMKDYKQLVSPKILNFSYHLH